MNAESGRRKRPQHHRRVHLVAAVLCFWIALAYLAALVLWPLIFGALLVALMFFGSFYLALFVWPYDEEL